MCLPDVVAAVFSSLKTIKQDLEKMSERGLFKRIALSEDDKGRIREFVAMISQIVGEFGLDVELQTYNKVENVQDVLSVS